VQPSSSKKEEPIARAAARAITVTTLLVLALVLATAPAASALSKPSVSTGSAHSVTFATATVTGRVNPNGASTSYYFQYGQTKAYGNQSAIAQAGSSTHGIAVSVALSGLQPLTRYHYRLVAVNAAGVTDGSDATFLTTKVPLSLAIVASPNPVPFGGAITIAGTLSGTGNGGRAVALQANGFPFTAGFQNVGNPELTSSSGGFSFTVLGMQLVTQFRVVTTAGPHIGSAVVFEGVAVRVVSHIKRTRRAHYVRIFGTVTPAADGMEVGILRVKRPRSVAVAGTVLRHRNATSSSYSRIVHVRRGDYRVLVRDTSGAQVSAYGPTLHIR
jgi:hypothetical protein